MTNMNINYEYQECFIRHKYWDLYYDDEIKKHDKYLMEKGHLLTIKNEDIIKKSKWNLISNINKCKILSYLDNQQLKKMSKYNYIECPFELYRDFSKYRIPNPIFIGMSYKSGWGCNNEEEIIEMRKRGYKGKMFLYGEFYCCIEIGYEEDRRKYYWLD